ncbi:MAG TPA: undecaprenyl-phosphate glucose phosphotransferase [Alphaproteobacteria bacterium]|jgi:putative colanic acid biosynthesis UDP-glucose lipid carrier transferase
MPLFRLPTRKEAASLIIGLVGLADLLVVPVAGVLAYGLRESRMDLPSYYVIAIAAGAVLTLNANQFAGLYNFDDLRRFSSQAIKLSGTWTLVALLLVAASYATKTSEGYSRLWAATWFFMSYAGMVLTRVFAVRQIDSWHEEGRLARRIAIVGGGEKGERLVRHLKSMSPIDVEIVGIYDDRITRVAPEIEGVPLRGRLDDLIALTRREQIDEIILALPGAAGERLTYVLESLRTVTVDIKLCPDTVGVQLPMLGIDYLGGLALLSIHRHALSGWNRIFKGIEDRVLAFLGLVALAPLLLLVALAIRLDSPGPIFFRQRRLGFNNDEFTVLKFRTMRVTEDDPQAITQATRNDPRITRVGALLRRTSIDELPQLLNVLKGDMSLVGPRPHAMAHNSQYAEIVDQYLGRHRVKPGITGWAQVNGLRGETDTLDKMRRRVEYDLYYIDNWSLWFDLRILLLTPFVGFVNKNAY